MSSEREVATELDKWQCVDIGTDVYEVVGKRDTWGALIIPVGLESDITETAEDAWASWMKTFRAYSAERQTGVIYWRYRPTLIAVEDFPTRRTRYHVTARLAILPTHLVVDVV